MTKRQMNEGPYGFRAAQPVTLLFVFLFFLLFTAGLFAQNALTIMLPSGSSGADIQSALDNAPGPVDVVLPIGVFEIHQPIVLQRDGQTLRGSGPATVLFLADKANCPVVMLGAALVSPARPTSRVRVADLSINGNRENQQVEFWRMAVDGCFLNNNGIDVWNVEDAVVERVVCFRCRSGGLVASAGTRRLNVSDFTAYDNQFDGLACYLTEDSHFTRLFLHDNLGAGISLDLAFNQNQIEDAILTGNDLGVFMRHSKDNSFKGITIRNSRHHGIFMAQATARTDTGWELTPGTECTGNNFARLDITNCGGNAFLVNNTSCTNNPVTDSHYDANALDTIVQAQVDKKKIGVP